jgi:hypothetical protein
MGGKRRAKKGAAPSDDELIEAAIAQAHAERHVLEAAQAAPMHAQASTYQARARATKRLIEAVEARAGAGEVRALLEEGASVDRIGGRMMWWPLYTAASDGDAEVVRVLLDGGADANKATNDVGRCTQPPRRASSRSACDA